MNEIIKNIEAEQLKKDVPDVYKRQPISFLFILTCFQASAICMEA